MASYQDILIKLGYPLQDCGDYWRMPALYRGGDNPLSLAVHKRTGHYRDFKANTAGSFKELVGITDGTIDLSTIMSSIDIERDAPPQKIKKKVYYPKECLKRLLPHYNLFLKRGISKETMETFEAGLAQSGKHYRRIVFPIYDREGRIVGFSGRWFSEQTPSGKVPKWKHTSGKTSWLYPCHLSADEIRRKKEVIVVESIGDVLALWEAGIRNVLCIFGTSMSPKVLLYIMSLDPERIIIATNNEPDNEFIGNNAARDIRAKMLKLFSPERILIKLPTKKDFGMMNVHEIQDWYVQLSKTSEETAVLF